MFTLYNCRRPIIQAFSINSLIKIIIIIKFLKIFFYKCPVKNEKDISKESNHLMIAKNWNMLNYRGI